MIYLIVLFILLFAYLSWKKMDWAIYLVIAALPSYLIRWSFGGVPLTALETMILILFLVFLIKNKFTWLKSSRGNQFFWPIMAILASAILSVFVSPDWRGAAGIWKAYFIEPVLFFIIITQSLKKENWKNVFWALGISAAYLSLFAFWQYFSAWGVPRSFLKINGAVDRVVSIFGYPNALGLYLGPITVIFGALIVFAQKIPPVKIALVAMMLAVIVLAKSEAAIVAIIAVALIGGLSGKKTRVITLAVAAIAVIIFFINQPIHDFVATKLLLRDWSGIIRQNIWQETGAMLRDNWLFGAGLAGYQAKIAPYHANFFEIYLYPHNIMLNFWSELGLLGLLSFLWFFVKFFWLGYQKLRDKSARMFTVIAVAAMAEIIIHGLVDAPYFKNDLSVLFWLIAALIVVDEQKANSQ